MHKRFRGNAAIRQAAPRLEENDTMTGSSTPWQRARLAALDLEGSGAQDRDNEAIGAAVAAFGGLLGGR